MHICTTEFTYRTDFHLEAPQLTSTVIYRVGTGTNKLWMTVVHPHKGLIMCHLSYSSVWALLCVPACMCAQLCHIRLLCILRRHFDTPKRQNSQTESSSKVSKQSFCSLESWAYNLWLSEHAPDSLRKWMRACACLWRSVCLGLEL